MNLRRLSARTAAAGVTTVLTAGAIVSLGTAAADAATVSNNYTCTVAALSQTFDTTVTITGDLPLTSAPAGFPVPAGQIGLTVTATVPAAMASQLAGFGVTHARGDDFGLALGKGFAPVPIEGDVAPSATGATWTATGKNKAFVLPGAGTAAATSPKSFNLTVVTRDFGDVPVPCALSAGQAPQTLGTIALAKQTTKTTAKAKPAGKVTVMVKGNASPATSGQVVILDGKKVVGKANVKMGKAVVKLKKLAKGTHKLVASFKGNDSFKSSKSKAVTVVVK